MHIRKNVRLTPQGRLLLVNALPNKAGVSGERPRPPACRPGRRTAGAGATDLAAWRALDDRSSAPQHCPHRTPEARVAAIEDGVPGKSRLLKGSIRESVLAPLWKDNSSLYVATDWTGWWNIYQVGLTGEPPQALFPAEEEFAGPLWQLGARPFAMLGDGRLAVLHGRGGMRLGILDPETSELADLDITKAAKLVRGYAERGDEMALAIFRQQAMAMGRVFSVAAKFTDPDTYFVGGGVIEAAPHFRDWFVITVKEHTEFYVEQAEIAEITLVPDLDMAGARGSAIAAAAWVRSL